jgi:hypothetical protein
MQGAGIKKTQNFLIFLNLSYNVLKAGLEKYCKVDALINGAAASEM